MERNKKVYHHWLSRYLKELDDWKKIADINTFKYLVNLKLEDLKKCLTQVIILDFEQELGNKKQWQMN